MAIIRVSGPPGSGKTTLCDKLERFLGYENHYIGGMIKTLANLKGISEEEFYRQLESDPDLERELDSDQESLMMKEDNLIVQGRIAPFLRHGEIFKTVNVLVNAEPAVCAERLRKRPKNSHLGQEEMLNIFFKRIELEIKRYKDLGYNELYKFDYHLSEKYFDIIIDTTRMGEHQAFGALRDELIKFGIDA